MAIALMAAVLPACSEGRAAERTAVPEGEAWLTRDQAAEARISTAPVEERELDGVITTSGKIGFDDLHVAHVYSPVTRRAVAIKARLGERVKKGQALALVGNSGNTTGPHLHFHVMDGLSVLGAQGVPYVIDSFTLAGEIADIPDDEGANAMTKALAIKPLPPLQRRMEYPMENAVVDFPGGK